MGETRGVYKGAGSRVEVGFGVLDELVVSSLDVGRCYFQVQYLVPTLVSYLSRLEGISHVTDTMGRTGIRTVCKVDFDTPASEQPYLHVSGWLCWGSMGWSSTDKFQNRWHPDSGYLHTRLLLTVGLTTGSPLCGHHQGWGDSQN
jgi:hypothetical protein